MHTRLVSPPHSAQAAHCVHHHNRSTGPSLLRCSPSSFAPLHPLTAMTQAPGDAEEGGDPPTPLPALITMCEAAAASGDQQTRAAMERIVHLLSSSSTSPLVTSSLLADVGYDILHELLPLLSPSSTSTPATPQLLPLSSTLLHLISRFASPREIFLPLLSHLSSHTAPLATAAASSDASSLSPAAVAASHRFVVFLLPPFLQLLQRERHEGRRRQMLTALWGHLLVQSLALSPSADYLAALLAPLLPLLSPSSSSDVAVPLAFLGVYLPSSYPPSTPPPPTLLSALSFLSASPLLSPSSIIPLVHRRQGLEGRLRELRLEAWEVSEETEAEMARRREEEEEKGGEGEDGADDWDDAGQAEGAERVDEQKRAELRAVKAELAALPQWSVDGLTCYLLLLLHPLSPAAAPPPLLCRVLHPRAPSFPRAGVSCYPSSAPSSTARPCRGSPVCSWTSPARGWRRWTRRRSASVRAVARSSRRMRPCGCWPSASPPASCRAGVSRPPPPPPRCCPPSSRASPPPRAHVSCSSSSCNARTPRCRRCSSPA